MKRTPVHNAGIPRANFHKTRTQIAHNGGLLFTQILKMCRVQEKDLVLRKARLKKTNLSYSHFLDTASKL